NLAHWTGQAGDPASARDQYAALLPDITRILCPDHTDTLATRHNLAHWTGQAGDPASARDQCAALLADRTRILGPDHPSTIRTQWEVGRWTLLSDHRLAELGLPEAVLAKLATEYSLLPLSPGQALSLAHDMTAIGESAALVALAQALIRPGGAGVWLAAYQDVGGVSDEVTETLAAAVDGDPEARMRLPEELRRLVDERHVQG
ncbi:MAG TPA: tetratricopeptide repeat protein, partial [Dermatophilaceae bacterium]|nr:tetratricopeptide repeat protein [Dermatophilaceae bacterium]